MRPIRVICTIWLAALSAAARADPTGWLVATSPHFQVFSRQSEAALRETCEGLERYDATLRQLTGLADRADMPRLTVYTVRNEGAEALGGGILGFYNPSASGPFAVMPAKLETMTSRVPLTRIVLYHEYAHHFMYQNFPALYSPWFVEGFAGFYSTAETENGTAIVGKPEPFRAGALSRSWYTSLSRLLMPGKGGLSGDQIDELYARSWLLVHFLTLSKERGGQIGAYLRARGEGQDEETAFRTAFHVSIAGMDAELKRYFAGRTLSYISVAVKAAPAVTVRPATQGEVALVPLMPRLRQLQAQRSAMAEMTGIERNAFETQARNLAIKVRAVGRRPDADAAVRVIEAEADLLADDFVLASDAAGKAVQLDPANPRAHLALASAIIGKAGRGDGAARAAARKEIVTANRLAPDDPMPLIAYFRIFADHGEPVPPLAVRGLERAQQLASQDDALRLMLAKEEIKRADHAYAAMLLRPVAFSPHQSASRDEAALLLKTLPLQSNERPAPVVAVAPVGAAVPAEGADEP